MPRDDRKPEAKIDDGWFIDFDDEDTLDIGALATARSALVRENRPPRRPEPRPMAAEPEPKAGEYSVSAQADLLVPEVSDLTSKAGATSSERGETSPEPVRQVTQVSTQAAPAPIDVDPPRSAREVDRTRQGSHNSAAAPSAGKAQLTGPEVVANRRGERTAAGTLRRRIASASLLAACLAGGVLVPAKLWLAQMPNADSPGGAPVRGANTENALRGRMAIRTAWRDPSTAVTPIEQATEVTALNPVEVASLEASRISVALAPHVFVGGQSPIVTSAALQPRESVPILTPAVEEAVQAPATVLARRRSAVRDDAPDVATATPLNARERHPDSLDHSEEIVADRGRATSPAVGTPRKPQRTRPILVRLVRKPGSAPAARKDTEVQVASKPPRSNRVNLRPAQATTTQVATRQTAVSRQAGHELRRPSTLDAPHIARSEAPRALVLPASLQPTPF